MAQTNRLLYSTLDLNDLCVIQIIIWVANSYVVAELQIVNEVTPKAD